jgi:hypothetical protein
MPRSSTKAQKAQHAAPTADGENTSAYFRRLFREDIKLLKGSDNSELFQRWLQDHPGHREVPVKVTYILHAVKTRLRQKRRQRRAERAAATPAAVAPVVSATAAPGPAAARRAGASLTRLEEQIDACLAVAREMDPEGLAEVIERLRAARNAVVRMAGG